MYFTYVVRPGDAPEGRGPQFHAFWDNFLNYNLRGGFTLYFLGYSLIVISSLLGGNLTGILGPLQARSKDLKNVPIFLTFLGAFMNTLGAVWIQNFRNTADDDARSNLTVLFLVAHVYVFLRSIKHSRGFRAGIKGLHHASLLDIVSWSMTTILLFSCMEYFDDEWTKQAVESGSTIIYASIARSLHGLSLLLYGCSTFLVENFHSQGTAEIWGWVLCFFYKFAGIFELLALVCTNKYLETTFGILFTLLLGMALLSSLFWSIAFEGLVTNTDVKMTQSAMRNEFYKSRNAMAYYGPPTCVEMEAQSTT